MEIHERMPIAVNMGSLSDENPGQLRVEINRHKYAAAEIDRFASLYQYVKDRWRQ